MHVRLCYTIAFKLEDLAKLDELNGHISTVAKFFSIPHSRVQDWNTQIKNLTNVSGWYAVISKRHNIPSDNQQQKKPAAFPEMEIALIGSKKKKSRAYSFYALNQI